MSSELYIKDGRLSPFLQKVLLALLHKCLINAPGNLLGALRDIRQEVSVGIVEDKFRRHLKIAYFLVKNGGMCFPSTEQETEKVLAEILEFIHNLCQREYKGSDGKFQRIPMSQSEETEFEKSTNELCSRAKLFLEKAQIEENSLRKK